MPDLPDHRPIVDHEPALHPDLGSSGRIVLGSRSVQPKSRRFLAPWHWNALVAIAAAPDTWTGGAPLAVVSDLAAAGLLDLTRVGEPERHMAVVNDAGRLAIRRGWYDVEDPDA